ncbi:site-specific integrase [Chroococcidiopsidales cyanobacterium LEGE 13417]|nr:site-specific integrase [Chroococcidiopsidales cyanobacterium LEGE 13417]
MASGHTLASSRRGGRNLVANPYALKEEELTDTLKQHLEQLESFWTSTAVQLDRENTIDPATFRLYKFKILCILGWLKNVQGEDLKQLSLEQIIDLSQLQKFVEWGIQTRKNEYGWALNVTKAALSVSRWLFSMSKIEEKPVADLQAYLHSLNQKFQEALEEKSERIPMTFKQSVMVVEYLHQCCAPLQKSGIARSESAIMRSWQRYLIVALLTYTPLRQREIRELKLGQSLIRDRDNYRICLNTKHKTNKEFEIPRLLTEDLDVWVEQFLPKILPKDNLVFIRLGTTNKLPSLGQPLSSRDISDLVSSAIYKATSILFDEPIRTPALILRDLTFGVLEQFSEPELIAESSQSRVTKQIVNIVRPQSQSSSILNQIKAPIQDFLEILKEEVEESDEDGFEDSASQSND